MTINDFFELFGGSIALASSIVACIVVNRRWKNDRHPGIRKYLVPVFYWGPLFLMSCMVMHIIRNAYNSITGISAGEGVFNFYHYSLQLFGFVLAYQSYLLLKKCRMHVVGKYRFNPTLYLYMGLIIASTLPTFIFTPIGIVPTVVLGIMLPVSLLVHRFVPAENVAKRNVVELQEIEVA